MQDNRILNIQRGAAHVSLALACALVWQPSAAQSAPAPGVDATADPTASVPAVHYRSVFKETSLGVEKDSLDWRKANDEVGKFTRGHVDILKWEEQQNATTPPAAPGSRLRKEELMKPGTAPPHHQK
jgi:hypothetical protein